MEIPILLGSRPSIANPGIWVPIRFDRWSVRVVGLENSKLVLYSNGPVKNKVKIILPTMNGAIYKGPCQVRVEFMERGTEKSITVFAEEQS
ncbi:hypothetical protein LCGC14_2483790 [marine sediment metagenome]|uniref:Uncharacterized protein n=1 Tax=marine sediment metagenome TaxID=412755 RepID=A0A0F9B6Q3_9ZZZZ